MIENIQKIPNDIKNELEAYLQENSKYSPYVKKRKPNAKLFPLVLVEELSDYSVYTTLKYTDEIYYIDLRIEVFAMQKGNVSNMTIAHELTNLIEQFFRDNYKANVRTSRNVANIDPNVYRNITSVSFKVETKYKDKLIISPSNKADYFSRGT